MNKKECPEQDSNLHASRHTHLKRARLPIPPPGHFIHADHFRHVSFLFNKWSGKRDSDPRPQPWQGCALPTELFPHFLSFERSIPLNADAKVMLFLELTNFLDVFFLKNTFLSKKNAFYGVNPSDFCNLRTQNDEGSPMFHLHATVLSRDEKYR